MLTGMGSLSYGELAGERMKLGLMLNDPEEEHDCFSDNTHNSHYYDGLGIRNVYLGSYTRVDGSVCPGPSLSDLVAAADPAVDTQLKAELDASVAALQAIKAAAEGGLAYDQMLAAGNAEGRSADHGRGQRAGHPDRLHRPRRHGAWACRRSRSKAPTAWTTPTPSSSNEVAMIVCHCQSITDHDIRAAVDWMRAADPDTVITPGKIYHALGKRADCGGCMPLVP